MASIFDNLSHAAERQAFSLLLDRFFRHLNKAGDRTKIYHELVNVAGKFYGKAATTEALESVRAAIDDPDNRWFSFIDRILAEADPHYAKMMLLNLGYEAFFRGTSTAQRTICPSRIWTKSSLRAKSSVLTCTC